MTSIKSNKLGQSISITMNYKIQSTLIAGFIEKR